MFTALLIVFAVILVMALVFTGIGLARGELWAIWAFFFGGVGQLAELLGQVVLAIVQGFSSGD